MAFYREDNMLDFLINLRSICVFRCQVILTKIGVSPYSSTSAFVSSVFKLFFVGRAHQVYS